MDTNTVADIATMVRRAVESTGETVLGLSKATGIPRTTLDRRMRGLQSFTTSELIRIAEHLGVSAAEWVAAVEAAA